MEGGGVVEDSTFYTQVNMTRTIEQILGLTPMNQFDLVASPMRTLFIDNPPAGQLPAVDARAERPRAEHGCHPDSDSDHPHVS
jgi:hypothetical protein